MQPPPPRRRSNHEASRCLHATFCRRTTSRERPRTTREMVPHSASKARIRLTIHQEILGHSSHVRPAFRVRHGLASSSSGAPCPLIHDVSSTSVDQEWPLHKLDLVDCERFLHRRAGGCLRSSELAISKKQFTQTMSEHLSEQQLRVADSSALLARSKRHSLASSAAPRNRSGSKPPLETKKKDVIELS